MSNMKQTMRIVLLLLLGSFAVGARADQALHQRPRYTLQPGDVVQLDYRYSPEFNQTVTIQPDGFVNLNVVGDVKLSEMTLDQAHALILSKAGERLNQPELNLELKDFQKPYVVVSGQVEKPGKIELREPTTALQAVMLSGGFKESARQSKVLVFRKINGDTAEVHQLNLNHLQKSADLERDFALLPGDMILVPRDNLEKVSRYIKIFNLGLYFNPTTF